MNTATYETLENISLDVLISPLCRAAELLVRLDERLARSELKDGLTERLLFLEARATQHAEGDLVHLEDLVLLDGAVFSGKTSIPFANALYTLRTWRRALKGSPRELLQAANPGEIPLSKRDEDETGPIPSTGVYDERLAAWRRILRQTNDYPPLLAAAIVWDAWLTLLPDPNGAWRAPLLSALVLKTRGLTKSFRVPVCVGRKHADYRREEGQDFEERILGYFSWIEAACQRATKELSRVTLGDEMLRLAIKGHQKNSHLPRLVDLFLERPLVTVPLAVKALRIRKQSVIALLPRLGSHIREITERKRCRVWTLN